ncbi:uncharacterized protein LOC124173986 [Ischnura elegans]|uniref:uncharacterized protein LOC124173986 n=1 Tax=Ischnura elegans TaxID=197161 RepID=UPI001ED88BC9|nr:uncharacterized protein LOC124173986 [Ischnura elegans]
MDRSKSEGCIKEICKPAEMGKHQAETLQGAKSVDAVSRKRTRAEALKDSVRHTDKYLPETVVNLCKTCNFKHKKGECRAFGKIFNNCGKQNHFAIACKFRKLYNNTKVKSVDLSAPDVIVEHDLNDFVIESVVNSLRMKDDSNVWSETINVNGVNVKFNLDIGAQVNVLPHRILTHCKSDNLMKVELKPTS